MKRKIVLIGAGEIALVANQLFSYDSEDEVVAYCVERQFLKETELEGKPVVAYEDLEKQFPKSEFFVYTAISAAQLNRLRRRFYLDLKSRGYRFASYVSSHAFVWRNAEVGENTFIFENNVVQPYVKIGDNCVLWSGNHIGHRTSVGSHSFITSHCVLSGYCQIGEGNYLGVNCTFNDKIETGPYCVVGSGALVVKNLQGESLYIGSPAKRVENKNVFELTL